MPGDSLAEARQVCVAPMMDYTDRHLRRLLRLISRSALLYTEMIPAMAIVRGGKHRLLAFDPVERPLAVQFGGSDPAELAECARVAADFGYDEVNLNVGCPSDRVTAGRFGACLMAEPDLVARCVEAMARAVRIPVTVKHRIGIDDRDDYAHLLAFVDRVAAAGCGVFIVHARKAWLTGLSPKQNRSIPPLRHALVHQLKADRPSLGIVTNGGIRSLDEVSEHLRHVDGVMIGRAVCDDPWLLAEVDRRFGDPAASLPERDAVAAAALAYVETQAALGVPPARITRHLAGLYHGQPGARAWRQRLAAMGGKDTRGSGGGVVQSTPSA